jgi:hypothetical protein
MERNNNCNRRPSKTSSIRSIKVVSNGADSSASTSSSGYVGEYEINPTIIPSQIVMRSGMARRWSIVGSYVKNSNLNHSLRNLRDYQHSTEEGLPMRVLDSVNPNGQGKLFF